MQNSYESYPPKKDEIFVGDFECDIHTPTVEVWKIKINEIKT